MPPTIDRNKCNSCGICTEVCPGDILAMVNDQPLCIYPDECMHCGACFLDCPTDAIRFRIPLPMLLGTSQYVAKLSTSNGPDR